MRCCWWAALLVALGCGAAPSKGRVQKSPRVSTREAVPTDLPAEARAAFANGELEIAENHVRRFEAIGDVVTALGIRAVLAEHRHDSAALRAVLAHPAVTRLRQSA